MFERLLYIYSKTKYADVAELADALDSGSSESFFHMGSSPFIRTIKKAPLRCFF